ncbi:hypothetical protein R1sor_015131 [Riccia sorocarpa]|uniref:Protein HEAT INTOLERANT 4-like n=1 Tax=Riccia sorocarpa TaxID=122646 RepID=A0ABD3HE41_9MARC
MASTSQNRSRTRQRASNHKNFTTISPEKERGRLADLWKEAFPVGTEWDQYEKVYEINWEFSNLENAFDEGGVLHGKKVYLFGCTEPQLLWFKDKEGNDLSRVVHIPAVVAVTSPFPPSDKVGIKSVQMEGEMILPMKEMKMDWIPYIPEDTYEHTSLERYKTQIYTLKCTQRRAALKQLQQERIKKYEYCLPYLYQPMKEDEFPTDTVVSIMYPFEDESKPPIVAEYDWDIDTYEDYANDLVAAEELLAEEKEKFMAFVKSQVMAEKRKQREAREARKKAIEEMSRETKDALENMRFYKFYPVKTDDTPDISDKKAAFINRYYGKASQVL